MASLGTKITLLMHDDSLRRKLLFVLGALAVFRLLANIPIPAAVGANLAGLLAQNQSLGFLNLLTGGGLSSLSLVMLGVGPYITSSIIMQLLTMMSEKLKAMYHEEGEAGKKKFIQISRKLTIPLAFLQGFGLIFYLKTQGYVGTLTPLQFLTNLSIIVAGSLLLMWIGELISEFGIGNGVSLIIFAGIVSRVPSLAAQMYEKFSPSLIPTYIGFAFAAVAIIAGIVTISEAERPVPITYAKQVRGQKSYGGVSTYLPLRVNQAGVIPIIFALSLLVFPRVVANFMQLSSNPTLQSVAASISDFLANTTATSVIYFCLVFAFTFFYTAVTFDPESIATNLQKNGAFIPGVRPGHSTAEHIAKILTRITFVGALFLAIIAVLPFVMIAITGDQSFAIGGTGLLIVVSVVLDLVKKTEAQLSMREY